MVKTYEEFSAPLLLPAHKEEPISGKMFLQTLYEMEGENIIALGNKMRSIIDSGAYMKVKHLKSGIEFLSQNENIFIFGCMANREFSVGKHRDIKVKEDSIVISLQDGSVFVLSIKEDYQITFVKPKIVIADHDPYGEEDWNET